MKTQTRILDNRLYYTRKIELNRKGKKCRTVRITPIVISSFGSKISVLITVSRVPYSKMGKFPTTHSNNVTFSVQSFSKQCCFDISNNGWLEVCNYVTVMDVKVDAVAALMESV